MDSLLDGMANGGAAVTSRVPVLMPVALEQTYDYVVPPGLSLEPGAFVLVPFGSQTRIGVIWDRRLDDSEKAVDPKKLKAVADRLDVPCLPVVSMRFAEWVAKYTLAPLGMVLRMMMSAQSAFEPPKLRTGVRAVQGAALPPRMTPARARALELAGDGLIRSKSALAELAGCSTGVIDGLVTSGNLVEVAIPQKVCPQPNAAHRVTEFGEDQERAVHALRSAVDAENFSVTLLDGVTGSGKTEVYFEAVARTLEKGRQALIMLPEIALTSQFMERFERRFGAAPVEWHSALSGPERGRIWCATATGEARIVIGARSALFLPFADLGLIVVDEEHDAGYKQDDRVHYQARDMSVVRGSLGKFPVVLASATPAIESHVNARTGPLSARHPARAIFGCRTSCHHSDRSARRAAGQRTMALAPTGFCHRGDDGKRPAIVAVSQSSGVRAPHALPEVRAPVRVSAMYGLACRAPLQRETQLSPLRLLDAATVEVPEVRRA